MNLTVTTSSHRLPLKYPFTISRYTVHEQETVIVAISNGVITGYGEATVNPYYQSTTSKMIDSVNFVKSIVENGFGFHPGELWQKLEPLLKDDYFALCAIDCAYWDFYSRLNNKPMHSFWSANEALEKASALKELGVEFIEQPLKAENWEGMKILKEKSALPIIADESCQKLEDVQKCAEFFDGINIKLMKCGGITSALKMIQKARALNLKIMAGCMTESSIGISNLAQLAPLLDYLDADGAMLLKHDLAEGVRFKNGNLAFSNENGNGAKFLSF